MSVFDESQLEMLEVFIFETNQLFEQFDRILFSWQNKKELNQKDLHAIFRIMHTTKSSAAMMNLEQLSLLMHQCEDLFSILREQPSLLKCIQQELLALLYELSDFMHEQLEQMTFSAYTPGDTQHLSDGILQLLQQVKQPQEMLPIKQVEALQEPSSGVCLRLLYEKDCMLENIRAYMLIMQIKPLCSTLTWYPEDLENQDDAAIYIQKNGFYIYLETTDRDRLLHMIKTSLFVEDCQQIAITESPLQQLSDEENKVNEIVQDEKKNSSFISVATQKLDNLQNFIGELMISRETLKIMLRKHGNHELMDFFDNTFMKISTQLEEAILSMRLVPFSTIVPKLTRVLFDISKKEHKEVNLDIHGEETEFDKEIIDHLFDPLMHLLRNAVDHGIESRQERLLNHKPEAATIILDVQDVNGEIQIMVKDDGIGLDAEKIRKQAIAKQLLQDEEPCTKEQLFQFLLLPGFSTKEKANEFSGRGVGLDVVKQMIDDFNGHLHINSVRNEGTTFQLHFPLTMAMVDSLIFTSGIFIFSIPMYHIKQFLPWNENVYDLNEDKKHCYYHYQDLSLPVLFLEQYYQQTTQRAIKKKILLCVHSGERMAILAIDEVIGYQKLIHNSFSNLLNQEYRLHTGISGYSLMGDGHTCYNLHIDTLLHNYEKGETLHAANHRF